MSAEAATSGGRRRSTRLTSKRAAKEEEESPSQVKRRKTNATKESESEAALIAKSTTRGLVPTVVIEVPAKPVSVEKASVSGDDEAGQQELDDQTMTVPASLDVLSSSSTALTGAELTQASSKIHRRKKSRSKSRSSRKKNPGADEEDHDDEDAQEEGLAADTDQVPSALDATSSSTETSQAKSVQPAPKKSSHVRFGSEEPLELPNAPTPAAMQELEEADEEEDSDDDAPEDITVSAAQVQSRAQAAEQARAIAE